MKQADLEFFRQNGFIKLGKIFTDGEVGHFHHLFDEDRRQYPYFWHPYGHHQAANYDGLITTPAFDGLIRHPRVYDTILELMGGPVCFGGRKSGYGPWVRTKASSTRAGIGTRHTGLIIPSAWTTYS